jgi:hypothetical protein
MWSGPIKLSPVHDRSYGGRTERTPIVEYALQQRINAFSPSPFNAAVDAQRISGTHYVNLADTL